MKLIFFFHSVQRYFKESRHKDEDLLKGQAVKNQKSLWDKTLEFRSLLQKAFSSSNRLPQEPVRSLFCGSHEGVNAAYSDLVNSSKRTLDSLVELEEALLEKNPSIVQATDSKTGRAKHLESSDDIDTDGDEDWPRISQLLSRRHNVNLVHKLMATLNFWMTPSFTIIEFKIEHSVIVVPVNQDLYCQHIM